MARTPTPTPNGGSPLDLAAAETALAAGRQVRVTLGTASGLPDGTRGVLVRLLDASISPECVVVRVDGDELPFAPGEVRSGWPRKADAPVAVPLAPVAPRQPSEAELTAAREYAETPRPSPRAQLAAVPDPVEPPAQPAPAIVSATKPAATKKPGRKAAPRLEVTLRHGEEGWTVGAMTGARVLLKGAPVEPAAAVALAQQLEVPAISALVGDIVDRARAEAAARVEELAAQLAAAEAELSSYGSPHNR